MTSFLFLQVLGLEPEPDLKQYMSWRLIDESARAGEIYREKACIWSEQKSWHLISFWQKRDCEPKETMWDSTYLFISFHFIELLGEIIYQKFFASI